MERLSPQKEIIVSTLRDLNWHCGREWLNRIKDDRIRISELNRTYMKEKGYEIVGEPCKGRFCGVKDCPLYARRARNLNHFADVSKMVAPQSFQERAKEMVRLFDLGKPASQIFSVV